LYLVRFYALQNKVEDMLRKYKHVKLTECGSSTIGRIYVRPKTYLNVFPPTPTLTSTLPKPNSNSSSNPNLKA